MSATATAHPAALAGRPRILFIVSMIAQFAAIALLAIGCIFLYSEGGVLGALAICAGGVVTYLAGVWIRDQSWAMTPSDAETYRTPAWVIITNETTGVLALVAMIVGMASIGSPLGVSVMIIVVSAVTGSCIVMAVRSAPGARTVRIVRAAAIGTLTVAATVITVIADGGLEEVSTASAVAGIAVLALFAGIGALCTFVWGRRNEQVQA